MDDASSYGAYLDFYNFAPGWALSTFAATHNFVASYVYSVPFDHVFGILPMRLTEGWGVNARRRKSAVLPWAGNAEQWIGLRTTRGDFSQLAAGRGLVSGRVSNTVGLVKQGE